MGLPKESRSLYWDVVKGLGIIAIVLGHTGYFAGAFVYLFHLALFFFITGYFYNEKKYGDSPFLYFGIRLSGAWPKYMFYTLFFVLFHNFFVRSGLYAGQELYNHTMMLTAWMQSLSFHCPEQVQGALWFVPVWLVSAGLFAGCVWFGRTAAKRLSELLPGNPGQKVSGSGQNPTSSEQHRKLWLCGLASCFLGLIGLFLNMRKCGLPYNLQAGLLVVPLYFLAWMVKLYLPDFKRWMPWYGCIISAFLLTQINSRLHIFIDLASMSVPGVLFYPISLMGIYFVLSLGRLTERISPLAKVLAFLGRQSFDIMAVHFLIFKLLDYGYARLVLGNLPENLSAFPVSFRTELGPAYILLGLFIPAFVGLAVDKLAGFLRGNKIRE